jgi:hypothetical protein
MTTCWNVAEFELAMLASQCLARRLPTLDTAHIEIAAWERQRNVERPTSPGTSPPPRSAANCSTFTPPGDHAVVIHEGDD